MLLPNQRTGVGTYSAYPRLFHAQSLLFNNCPSVTCALGAVVCCGDDIFGPKTVCLIHVLERKLIKYEIIVFSMNVRVCIHISFSRRIMVGVTALTDLFYCQNDKIFLIFFCLFVCMYMSRFFLLLVLTLAFQ
jgi:hypothetical protein